jgi:uncharacterized protein Yka (UPF0111/DUF47 family)
MTTKSGVIEQLGEDALLLPDVINDGLSANDRLKYYLTLLQAARAHAEQPERLGSTLRPEREASGVSDEALDDVVAGSRRAGGDVLAVPAAGRLRQALFGDLAIMIKPLRIAHGDGAARVRHYTDRVQRLTSRLSGWSDAGLPIGDVEILTRPAADEDTVHQVVMDLHRELNQLQATIARESLDGAKAYGLTEGDRPLVRAFMRGLNETAPLKGDHPGLGTTATHSGSRLCIQNDLGTTDGHVIVINVSGLVSTLIYTDVHRRRAAFFRSLLAPWNVVWQQGTAPAGADYEMSIGVFAAANPASLESYLAHVGSRLVFLIDWNKARKRLSRFLKRSAAVAILKWAADNNVGHRAFLEAGENALVAAALERSAGGQLRYGMRLDEIIGVEAALAFFQSALRIASEGMRAGRSRRLIVDEIEAELLSHIDTSERATLVIASEHAALLGALGDRVRRALLRARGRQAHDEAERTAALAKGVETRADELVRRSQAVRGRSGATELGPLLTEADVAVDALEQAAFLLTLAPRAAMADTVDALAPLADLVSLATREYVRSLECARELPSEPVRSDLESLLVAVDRLQQIEHDADGVRRTAEAQLVGICADFRELHVLSRIVDALEEAADALGRCGLLVRGYAMQGVLVAP